MALKQRLGQILREAGVYAHQHLNHWPEGRRIAILPSYDKATGSSLLRAWLVGNELVRQGWGVVLVPNQLDLKQRNRLLAHIEPDLIFLQKHRHQFNQPQLYPNYPCVFDLDDADFLDAEIFPIVERCCRGSAAVIAGSHYVADWCRQYNEDVTVVWTGTPYSHGRALSFNWERKGIVAWASSNPLLNPAEFALVERFLVRLAKELDFEFWLYGLDNRASVGAFIGRMSQCGVIVRTFPYMKYSALIDSLSRANVGLAPLCSSRSPYSRGKSFGKVLAYLAAQVPVIASDDADHRFFFIDQKNGFVSNEESEWVAAARSMLLDSGRRADIVANADASFRMQLTTSAAAAKVGDVFQRVLDRRRYRIASGH